MKALTIEECLNSIEDPRERSGRRFELSALLKLIVVGLISGHVSLTRIAKYGKTLPKSILQELGFRGTTPCVATLSNVLRVLEPKSLEKKLSQYTLKGQKLLEEGTHIAIDGKTLRGSGSEGTPAVHLLSAFVTKIQGVLGQKRMRKGENEIVCGLRLIKSLKLEGAIITADAIFAQKKNLPSHRPRQRRLPIKS